MRQLSVPSFTSRPEGYKIYERFRGLDLSTDQTQIDDGRSPQMVNMISDAGGYPQLRPGWRTLHTMADGGAIGGIFPFESDDAVELIVHAGTKLMRLTASDDQYSETELMTGLHAGRSCGFYMDGKLWILTGNEFLRYDGKTAAKVEDDAYIPTTSVLCKPSGGGTSHESVNLLTPWRKNTFVPDGNSRDFVVDTKAIDAGTTVKAWNNDKEITSGISFAPTTGKVTFATAPAAPAASGTASLVIQFSKTTEGSADKIKKCTIYATFGVNTGSRLFLSGNPDEPATEWYSGLNDPTYWPDTQYIKVGTSSFAITNYLKYQGELLVIKEDNRQENTIWHHTADFDTNGKAIFPLKEGVSGVGGCARFSMQVLRDDPLFLSPQGVYAPILTYGMNTAQRNLQCRSERINARLTTEDGLADAVAAVWQGYYLLAIGGDAPHIWIADANQDRSKGGYEWYYWEGLPVQCWGVHGDTLYFGTSDGRICRLNTDVTDSEGTLLMSAYADDGQPIHWEWYSKMDSMGSPTRYKTLLKRGNGIQLKAYSRASCKIRLRTEKDTGRDVDIAYVDIFDFNNIDFSRFTFSSLEVQEIIYKRKIKNFLFLQLQLSGDALYESAGIYSAAMHYSINEYAKKKR